MKATRSAHKEASRLAKHYATTPERILRECDASGKRGEITKRDVEIWAAVNSPAALE